MLIKTSAVVNFNDPKPNEILLFTIFCVRKGVHFLDISCSQCDSLVRFYISSEMNCIHILDDSHVFVINKKKLPRKNGSLGKTATRNETEKKNGEQLVPKLFVEM